MKRRRPDDEKPDDVHREILEHLADNPPPRPRGPKRSPVPATEARSTPEPPPTPRLHLRKMRLEPALQQLDAFVRLHCQRGTPRVVVVVGKGLRSGSDGPVIGPAVRAWCTRRHDLVRDHHLAPASEGGDGALVLHLSKKS